MISAAVMVVAFVVAVTMIPRRMRTRQMEVPATVPIDESGIESTA